MFWILSFVLFGIVCSAPSDRLAVNSYDPDYGVYVGDFVGNPEISGRIFVVNESAVQIIGFSFRGKPNDSYFWLSTSANPTNGIKIPTFEFGASPLDRIESTDRIVLQIPNGHKISQFKSLSVYSPTEKFAYSTVSLPDDLIIPKAQFLGQILSGSRYSLGSGPILIKDSRTIKIFAFTFDGKKAPDGYFFVGRGLKVVHDGGVKVPIRGRDSNEQSVFLNILNAFRISPMNETYRGGMDIIIDLPEGYDVRHIDWLSVFCYNFRIDYGHVPIGGVPTTIPPFVPNQRTFADRRLGDAWKPQPLLGSPSRSNFTLQLGPSGGNRGYRGMTGLRPPPQIWYVNGYVADVYLKRGVEYSFIVEGGANNSFYISEDPFGGYSRLTHEELETTRLFGSTEPVGSERQCSWESDDADAADNFDNFRHFKDSLRLVCANNGTGEVSLLRFTPNRSTPTFIYGNSGGDYNMGFKIIVVDELPTGLDDIHETPYRFEEWVNVMNGATNFPIWPSMLIAILVLNQ